MANKTNVGSNLTYTPLDDPNDWKIAKMMFNMNDFFHAQILHLANSHAVADIVHQAALLTMSSLHPVRAFLDHIMYQAYAIRPVGSQILFNPGGGFDQNFALNHVAVTEFVADFYPTMAGPFQSNYFNQNLIYRGLINCTYGPPLKHFPFAEDTGAIHDALQTFASSLVNTYYPSPSLLQEDNELQSWLVEASGPAQVIDFPSSPLTQADTLIDILTHVSYLTGVSHHVLNSATPMQSSAVLPFHPLAFYQPIPTTKGVESVSPFLPNLNASLNQITLLLGFIRPALFNSQRDLQEIFADSTFLAPATAAVKDAATVLDISLVAISDEVSGRTFDEEGLAQRMPFLWRNLDPMRIPFFLSV